MYVCVCEQVGDVNSSRSNERMLFHGQCVTKILLAFFHDFIL